MLILTSFMGYLEWAKDNSSFLFEAEAEIFSKLFSDPVSVAHPFTLLPLVGQLILLLTLFQKEPTTWLTYVGMTGIGILLLFMFAIGLISLNYKIVLSTLPFLGFAFLAIRHHRKMRQTPTV